MLVLNYPAAEQCVSTNDWERAGASRGRSSIFMKRGKRISEISINHGGEYYVSRGLIGSSNSG